MFLDCIDISFNEFTSYLDENLNYFFVIVHHENKNIVDYSEYFEKENYKEVIHVMTRERDTNKEIDLNDEINGKLNLISEYLKN